MLMKNRLITALIYIPLLVVCMYFYNRPLPLAAAILSLFCALALKEFYSIAEKHNAKPNYILGAISVVALFFAPYVDVRDLRIVILVITVFIAAVLSMRDKDFESGTKSWIWSIAGVVYLGFLPSYFVSLGLLSEKSTELFWTIFTVFGIDTFSFFVGSLLGKHKFAPVISPKKSWEGLVGGFIGAYVVGLGIWKWLDMPLELWQRSIIIYVMFVFAVLGDLFESYLKRSVNEKDASHFLPGHGGFMDRLDSQVFCPISVYYLLLFM